MNPDERKSQFVVILQNLLASKCNGVQVRLAKQLQISTSRISRWLQGQVDPINLETSVFARIAMLKGSSAEELAHSLNLDTIPQNSSKKFKLLLEQMLSDKTQEELGKLIGVSQFAISNWLNLEKNIDPGKIPVGNMLSIAREKGWTFDELLSYLDLQKQERNNSLIKYQIQLSQLALAEKEELLVWLSQSIKNTRNNTGSQIKISNKPTKTLQVSRNLKTICTILEKENIKITSHYSSNLVLYFQIQPDNLEVTTISKITDLIEDFDLLIFDIETNPASAIALINQTSFNSDIVIFTPQDLEAEVRQQLEDKVTDIVVKPIDWDSLKDKPYFTST